MQEEKDYIQREIERLTWVLKKLIEKALGIKSYDFEQEIQNIESELRNEFDLTLKEISEMEDLELTEKIKRLHEEHLEKLAELIEAVAENSQNDFRRKIMKKGIVVLDYLDNTSKTFSLKRMELKNMLQQPV